MTCRLYHIESNCIVDDQQITVYPERNMTARGRFRTSPLLLGHIIWGPLMSVHIFSQSIQEVLRCFCVDHSGGPTRRSSSPLTPYGLCG